MIVLPKVAALFVLRDSIYKSLSGVECFDVDRDARSFAGGMPVVAHPPCGAWCALKAFSKATPDEKALAPWAVDQVRRWGGVLEHPARSSLWRECEMPGPGFLFTDNWGGWTVQVDQFVFGHRARKRTWVYIVGTTEIPPIPRRSGEPPCVIDCPGSARKSERPRSAGQRPWCSRRERSSTPPAFAEWLVAVARKKTANLKG